MHITVRLPVVIHVDKNLPNKTDSVFYHGRDIASVTIKNEVFVLCTTGTYSFRMKSGGKLYISDNKKEFNRIRRSLTDARIKKLGSEDLVSNWGWFGVIITDHDNNVIKSSDEVFSSYDEALKGFVEYVKKNIQV